MASSDLTSIFTIASSGLQAQTVRMKVVAENLANAGTTPASAAQKPYQRQVVTFKNEFDRAMGAYVVKVAGVQKDKSDFVKKYDPSHPAADKEGYVLTPNVKPIMESMDMREAQRSYDANLNVIEAARVMLLRTIDLLRT
jgi:flagellar basal-body rod protein FlgC